MINLDLKDSKENIKLVLEKDYIDRNKYLNGLINILNSLEESKIIALDGDWGSGKTFFLKSLKYLMENETTRINNIETESLEKLKREYMIFYYNAWENDDASSAMLSLIYKLINDSCLKKNENKVSLIPNIVNTIIKFKTNGALDLKEDWSNGQITKEIETSEEIKEKFIELLNELLVENKNKILIIIDEIDRCKPTFAIDLLENIKHFYDDDRVVFIVGTNNKQLGASVCKVYGEKYDGYTYLDKFFDINLELPNNYLEKFINATNEMHSMKYYPYYNCEEMAKQKKLTMREYNRYIKSVQLIEVYLNTEKNSGDMFVSIFIKHIIIPLCLCMKIKEKEKYYKLLSGDLFEEIDLLVKSNEIFYETAEEIVNMHNKKILNEIKTTDLTNKEIKNKKIEIILKELSELYFNLTKNNEYKFWNKKKWEDMLNVISLMN